MKKVQHSVKITDEFKEEALQLIEDEVTRVFLQEVGRRPTKRQIDILTSLSLSQFNTHVSFLANMRTQWSLIDSNSIPVIMSVPEEKGKNSLFSVQTESKKLTFVRNNAGEWIATPGEGVTKAEVDTISKEMALEDLLTSVFFSTLSYVDEFS